MANIQERRDKHGKLISYSIRVHRGRGPDGKQLKPYTATFEVSPTWTEKSARKKAEAFAATFEKSCREGTSTDSRLKFSEYCDYVIKLKESRGTKHSTLVRYRELTERIYPELGHLKLKDIRVDHLNAFYTKLMQPGSGKAPAHAIAKADLKELIRKRGLSRAKLSELSGVPIRAVYAAVNGERVKEAQGQAIAEALKLDVSKSFSVERNASTLSPKTVIEHHRFISTVLDQAEKEGLVPLNVASKATLPKLTHKEVNYFQPEEIAAIRDALELEPIKWRTLVHLFLITGARRGEILGLAWSDVDFEKNRIYIQRNVLYSPERGIYIDTPKTEKSKRYIALPRETMELLRKYRLWQMEEMLRLGGYYQRQDFVFSQDNGSPMHPDSVTGWLDKFSKRHGLPHVNPHAFRHSVASMLYFSGVDSVSISRRLGHAQVSTTANIYAHVIEEADQHNADVLADAFLKSRGTGTG